MAVLFDLDGTLLDPNGSIRATIDAVIEEGGLEPIPPGEILIGMPLREILATRTGDKEQIGRLVQRFRAMYMERTLRMARVYPGVAQMLEDLPGPLAVVTTKGQAEAEAVLESLGLARWFAAIVGDDDRRPVKPDPAPVLEACRQLGVPVTEATMVGDTSYDIEAGRRAGCRTVGVLWGHGSPAMFEQADAVARDVTHLCAILTT